MQFEGELPTRFVGARERFQIVLICRMNPFLDRALIAVLGSRAAVLCCAMLKQHFSNPDLSCGADCHAHS
jgi:hypothetical protein